MVNLVHKLRIEPSQAASRSYSVECGYWFENLLVVSRDFLLLTCLYYIKCLCWNLVMDYTSIPVELVKNQYHLVGR